MLGCELQELLSDKTNLLQSKDLGIDISKLPQPKNYDNAIERVANLSNNAKTAIAEDLQINNKIQQLVKNLVLIKILLYQYVKLQKSKLLEWK